jgi:hypothetical protein
LVNRSPFLPSTQSGRNRAGHPYQRRNGEHGLSKALPRLLSIRRHCQREMRPTSDSTTALICRCLVSAPQRWAVAMSGQAPLLERQCAGRCKPGAHASWSARIRSRSLTRAPLRDRYRLIDSASQDAPWCPSAHTCAPARRCTHAHAHVFKGLSSNAVRYKTEDLVPELLTELGIPRADVFVTTKLHPKDLGSALAHKQTSKRPRKQTNKTANGRSTLSVDSRLQMSSSS